MKTINEIIISVFIENIMKDMGCDKRSRFPKTLVDFISTELYKYFYPTKFEGFKLMSGRFCIKELIWKKKNL